MTCEDGHKHCDYWAKNDECKKNPEWYISNVSLPYLLVIIETLILLHKSLLLQPGQFIFLLQKHHCLFLSLSISGCWSAALFHAISARTSVMTTMSIARSPKHLIMCENFLKLFLGFGNSIILSKNYFRIGQS